jgi:hypothetical protein
MVIQSDTPHEIMLLLYVKQNARFGFQLMLNEIAKKNLNKN